MKHFVVLLCAVLLACASAQAEWQVAKGPLLTKWASEVSPSKALPEYPRPQLVRKEWQNLNGLWDYAIVKRDAEKPASFDGQILVPFCAESALSGVMKKVTPEQKLWYRRTFTIPAAWNGQRTILHFGAVDWDATVFVNGKQMGEHKGGYDAFSYDITDALKAGGEQELVVSVWDPTNTGSQPRGKQVLNPGGIFYTANTGIWQTVWMEPVPQNYVRGLKITPDIDKGELKVTVNAAGQADNVTVVALDGEKQIATASGKAGSEITLKIDNAKLWTPESPFLYGLKVTAGQDSIDSYFGMRKIALGKDEKGITRPMLNNKYVFEVGTLDQGFWPDGIYTAPTDEALRYDVEMLKKYGFNMTRKHVKTEPDRWYYWCDKLGLLVWQDMPAGDNKDDASKKQFEVELKAMVDTYYNHPSIILWVVFNEGWGQHDTERLTAWVKEMDPSRLVNNASGWTDKKCGDVLDMHNYPGPGSPKPEEKRAAVLGEFGGLGLAIPNHTWSKQSWGYKGMADQAALTKRYCKLFQKAWQLNEQVGLSAAVYTQTTDVETECNGLMTYDRAINKVDVELGAKAARNQPLPEEPAPLEVVPTSETKAQTWSYTTEKPADDWFKPEFNDSAWKTGPAGFGTIGGARTPWKGDDTNIWMRRTVEITQAQLKNPRLMVFHDDEAEVYINGVLAAKLGGYNSEYDEAAMTPEGVAAIKPGKNVIAVHCHQDRGGQYIDVGIVADK